MARWPAPWPGRWNPPRVPLNGGRGGVLGRLGRSVGGLAGRAYLTLGAAIGLYVWLVEGLGPMAGLVAGLLWPLHLMMRLLRVLWVI